MRLSPRALLKREARRPARALRVLISAGPTREPIDPVRFLSNYSTGYMGALLAGEALERGHRVVVVSGPVGEAFPPGARLVRVERAQEMERAMRRAAPAADVIIMAAAVADFRARHPSAVKLSRYGRLTLSLEATPDILARLPRRAGQLVVGFALETGKALPRAKKKLRAKRLDLLLAQQARKGPSPFGRRSVHAWLLSRSAAEASPEPVRVKALGSVSKKRIARVLLDKIEALWYGQPCSEKELR